MPKETVRNDSIFRGSAIHVGWSRDSGDAQLGVTLGSRFIFVDKKGMPISEDDADQPDIYDSLWFTFTDRGQVNSLIRKLRKARDQAFGRDE